MVLDTPGVRQKLREFDLTRLFIDYLGWDRPGPSLEVPVDGQTYSLRAVAEKRGVQVFECTAPADGEVPDRTRRQKIDREVTKAAREHLIVFSDKDRGRQVWQWVAREPGKPTAFREHPYAVGQAADVLIQKLDHLRIPISEEEAITLVGVVERLKDTFNKDRVTKRFYDRFRSEQQQFLSFIAGIREQGDREWYASLMLNRLMFIYFIQKKRFLDGDDDYLRHRLQRVQAERGTGSFLSFYRYFLRRLFHEGLSAPEDERSAELDVLLGRVPYLNGGLFDVHQIEEQNPAIDIPDEAFEKLFAFFDAYQWHLDDRPLREGNEINPDVLGYIFEKYVNQKQMGAYYTKEDITEYIGKNTIVPFLLDAAAKECAIAFRPGEGSVWRLLQDEPGRYIYPSVRHGVDEPLPSEIEAGIGDVAKRGGWNRPAPATYALPTETWREHIARRQRCTELRQKLAGGEVTAVNDLVTLNLNIRQFVQDAIERCEGPELLRAFFKAIEKITILDPTCGSGAFLFAALNILQPLYVACLERMEAFVNDLEVTEPDHHPAKFGDFRAVLQNVAHHPSREYFILKSIILNNLYGVDIMEEAVEICKLRLFLKLVAQIEAYDQIEPLPDVDFNIRAGNTLVGFATYEEAMRAFKLDLDGVLPRVNEAAADAARAFERFHEMQTEREMYASDFREAKGQVRDRFRTLGAELDRYLAGQYGVDPADPQAFRGWLSRHHPFHWLVDFHAIMQAGGFQVIIGNPPYIGFSARSSDPSAGVGMPFGRLFQSYRSVNAGNLYAITLERSMALLSKGGRWGFIVPLSITFAGDMANLRKRLMECSGAIWHSSYDNIPDRAFTGAKESSNTSKANQQRVTIVIGDGDLGRPRGLWSTPTLRWRSSERAQLFESLPYGESTELASASAWPKVAGGASVVLLTAIQDGKRLGSLLTSHSRHSLVVPKTAGYYIAAYADEKDRTEQMKLCFRDERARLVALVALNSNLFFWWYRIFGDGFHVTRSLVESFPIPADPVTDPELIARKLLSAHDNATVYKSYRGEQVPNVNYNLRMDLLHECDQWLWSELAPGVPFDWELLLRYKSTSWFSFEVAKAAQWPDGTEFIRFADVASEWAEDKDQEEEAD